MQDYVYGQFIEHLGKCIYGGIWAEVLDDRKFFYPPNHANSPWKVAGNIAGFSMDKNQAYVGEHSTTLAVGNERVELHQDGLGIKENMGYSGRIVLKATGDVSLDLSLRWGDAPEQASNMTIDHLPDGFTTFPISFKSTVHHQNATLVLRPEGKGQIWIGTLSLMPDDHTEGFRTDVLELLKELNSPVYRWPGGNFVSGYDWKDGIGDPDMRPPRKNPAWTGVEHNDVGIHEFMRFCELLKTEAYIAVNAGLGGAEEARKQVEYCIGATETPMGKWRSENGHPEPWTIEWWSVGNEMYGGWQLGHMPTEKFAQKHNEFADAMWSVNPDIKLVAVGNPGPWNEMILANCADRMDYISEHFYKQDWHGGGLMTHIRQIPDAIRERAEIHREYRNSIPGLAEKDIQICLDEWNYWYGPHIYGELGTRYFMRDALGVAAGINEFSKQSDLIYMANYAQTVNVIGAIKATNTQSVMAATGQALTMYRKYFGTIPIAFTGDVRPLDIAATLTADRKYLCVSLVNLSWSSHQVKIDFDADFKYSDMEVYTLKAVSDMAYNVPGQEKTVTIEEQQGLSFNGTLAISPVEARIYRFKLEAN